MSLVVPAGFFAASAPAGPAQPTFRSFALKTYNDSAMAAPAGMMDGDGLIYIGNAYYESEADAPESYGWTKLLAVEGDVGAYRVVYHRVAAAEPADYYSRFGHYTYGIMACYSGFSSIGTVGAWQTAGGGSRTFSAPVGAGKLLGYTQGDSPYAIYTFPAGMTLRTQYWAPNLCDQPSGGDGGNRTWESSIPADIWCLMMTIQ